MIKYVRNPVKVFKTEHQEIYSFIDNDQNIDWETVNSFGEEWQKFKEFDDLDLGIIGKQYFDIVEQDVLNKSSNVLDVGCGTGRWTKYIADQVQSVEAIDPSEAVFAAGFLLKNKKNVRITQASVDNIPFPDNSFDLVFSLGVLHHLPDTGKAIMKCVSKIKPGGKFLIYLYYNLENRGVFFKLLFSLSNIIRRIVSKLPQKGKFVVCDFLAVIFYMPFISISRIFQKTPFLRKAVKYIPLSFYRDKSFHIIRNDALDRFGTPLEKRFSRKEIESLMVNAGLNNITFSDNEPYWHAIGTKQA